MDLKCHLSIQLTIGDTIFDVNFVGKSFQHSKCLEAFFKTYQMTLEFLS